jgi:trypsin
MIVDRDDGSFLCSGSIISQNWAVTAAHCFGKNPSTAKAKIKLNVTNYRTEGSWKSAEKIIVSEGYNDSTHEHDVALVRGSFLSAGRIIPLAAPETPLSIGEKLVVSGWGDTEKGVPSDDLLMTYVPYVTNETCNRPESYNNKIQDGMLCAGEKGADSCQGDSGGPLAKGETPATAILVGVVSFGYGCGEKLKYGVYTRVSSERDWIRKTTAANEPTKSKVERK